MRKNCWAFKQCGRQPGGAKNHELGVCPAAITSEYDGMNCVSNGGRLCWHVAGTFCGGKVQGVFAQKPVTCMSCDFYLSVKAEEGKSFVIEPATVGAH